jgi:hypothetical protein
LIRIWEVEFPSDYWIKRWNRQIPDFAAEFVEASVWRPVGSALGPTFLFVRVFIKRRDW